MPGNEGVRRLFVGVGIDHYEHFDELKKAVEEIRVIGDLLHSNRGYEFERIEEVSDSEAEARFKAALPKGSLVGGALVILWAGHGEISTDGVLRLITRDAEKDDTPTRTGGQVAGWAGRSGARQILLIFDTCYSGRAVIDAARVIDRLKAESPEPKPLWVGVLASAQEYQTARDGVFFDGLRRVLTEGPRSKELLGRFSPFNKGISGIDVLLAVVSEWTVTAHTPLQLNTGVPEMMFPNPLWNPATPEGVVEHLLLAAQGRSPEEEGVFFTGRSAQLGMIVDWLTRSKSGVLVVTGPAGCGKSAIVGRIVSLSNPIERHKLKEAGEVLEPDPGEGSVQAHVHARRLNVDQVAERVYKQLSYLGLLPFAEGPLNRYDLLGKLLRLEVPVTVVIDGLDEAENEAWTIADELINPLGRIARVRVVVASRELTRDNRSLVDSMATLPPIDLGNVRWLEQTKADLKTYVQRRLDGINLSMNPQLVAEHIVGLQTIENEGLFLLVGLITTQLRADPIDTNEPGWEKLLAASVEQVFDRDLARVDTSPPAGGDGPKAAKELLAALAWGYGNGVPDDVWAVIATALSSSSTVYTTNDIYWVLASAGRYVITEAGGDRAVYRLSHLRLADYLCLPRRIVDWLDHDYEMVKVAMAMVGRYRMLLDTGLPSDKHHYLWLYLGLHCVEAGQPGITELSRLASSYPDLIPTLAGSLTNLGNRYQQVGRLMEAIPVVEEAVELYRQLAADNPVHIHDLAIALSNLGPMYGKVLRLGEALVVTFEAVERLRPLVADNLAYLPNLAMALSNLGLIYRDLGSENSISVTEEAVEYYRQLAEENSDYFYHLVMTKINLGMLYFQVGRLDEAIVFAEEAVERLRPLAADNPAHIHGLALALTNLCQIYLRIRCMENAIAVAEEAVKLFRRLVADNPTHIPDLALALGNLSLIYGAVGRSKEAIAFADEAVKRLRPLTTDRPAYLLPNLAQAVMCLAICYLSFNYVKEGLPVAEEAVERYRRLAEDNPAYLLKVDMALNLINGVGTLDPDRSPQS